MLWLHSLKVAQLLRSAACLHTNQSRSYLNHLVQLLPCWLGIYYQQFSQGLCSVGLLLVFGIIFDIIIIIIIRIRIIIFP